MRMSKIHVTPIVYWGVMAIGEGKESKERREKATRKEKVN